MFEVKDQHFSCSKVWIQGDFLSLAATMGTITNVISYCSDFRDLSALPRRWDHKKIWKYRPKSMPDPCCLWNDAFNVIRWMLKKGNKLPSHRSAWIFISHFLNLPSVAISQFALKTDKSIWQNHQQIHLVTYSTYCSFHFSWVLSLH